MHRIPRIPAPLAFLGSLAYGTVVRARNALYDSGTVRCRRLRNPVISIGNLTTGGTGKTPLVIRTARIIWELGRTPAILTRGYGRSAPSKLRIIAPGETVRHPADEMGDEPALIRRHIPEAWFGISRKRAAAGMMLEGAAAGIVFILDDGFQHRKLHRDLDIVVVDASRPLRSDRILPCGSLREPVTGLRRSDALMINGTTIGATGTNPVPPEIPATEPDTARFHCEQVIDRLTPFESWAQGASAGNSRDRVRVAFLVAALGNPLRFQRDIEKYGIRVSGSRFFRDHAVPDTGEWKDCVEEARKAGADAVVISEKDAVKISSPPDFPLFVAVQNTRIQEETVFVELLRRIVL